MGLSRGTRVEVISDVDEQAFEDKLNEVLVAYDSDRNLNATIEIQYRPVVRPIMRAGDSSVTHTAIVVAEYDNPNA